MDHILHRLPRLTELSIGVKLSLHIEVVQGAFLAVAAYETLSELGV